LQGVTLQGDLSQLLHLLDGNPAFRELIGQLKQLNNKAAKALVLGAAKPYLIAALYRNLNRPILVVTAQPENAKKLAEQIMVWGNPKELDVFPEPDTLAYQRIIADPSIEQERLQVLYSLSNWDNKGAAPFLIASSPALIQKSAAKEDFFNSCSILRSGDEIDPVTLMGRWESMGYLVENMVETPGAMSRRGGIVDIFPPTSDLPVRVEFFGNTIESIRHFDTASQRSQKVVAQVAICPATEILPSRIKTLIQTFSKNLDLSNLNKDTRAQFEEELSRLSDGQRLTNISFYSPAFNAGNLLDYLPSGALVILDEPFQIQEEVDYLENQSRELREQKIAAGELPANFPQPYFDWKYLDSLLKEKSNLSLLSWAGPGESGVYDLHFNPAPSYAGQLPALINKSKALLDQNFRLIFVSNQASRLSELLEEEDIYSQPITKIQQIPSQGSITLLQSSLSEGWVLGNTYLLTDKEIFGFVKEPRLMKRRAVQRHKLLVDIKPGDYVVHIEHGIGQFTGVTTMNTDSTRKEYLLLTYAEGDKLYVPTDQIDRISRYVGSGEQEPALSRLGTQEWSRTKQKVKEAVEEIAQDLLQLYAKREVVSGYAFSPDSVWQSEMEASFPYIETPDQMKVQEEVKEDMSRARPMDRLVVGDVGYGKTEIAIRAAFKAVMDNKQVAVLVPTTVLAEQHYVTFKQRMGAFPVKIEVLSRFRTPKEQKSVIQRLADGSVDICIGTHRLLQKDVVFKDLGLLVIDEEQRFGVAHKEYLKKLREQVDVLTLSATPIPRTLHMSLVGVRDMSVIETPPENRLPIRTYVAEYSDQLVREAILRELERNGQVFFVHNRVQGISMIAEKIKNLVPEARLDIAHGQMPEDQLEKVMVKFQQGENNVLVCTTIIESGLDLPNVNTLIVNRADRFGLTQLYQLRGRIGRGSNLAYAYFLYDKQSRLNPAAEKRLRTIYEATELGAGFGIAMKDLEIRGAGSLLGTRQSGNIAAVGFNLYTQLLAQAVEEQKSLSAGHRKEIPAARRPEPSVDLPLKALIPDDYISDTDMRLSIYQRLTAITTVEQTDDLAKEINDRFGPLPAEVQNLIEVVRIKCLAANSGVEAISTNESIVTIRIWPGLQFNRQKLVSYYRYGVKIGMTQLIININKLGKDWLKMLEDIVKAIS
jgi:transcription-repair coupling factor (superfamily II helicase)